MTEIIIRQERDWDIEYIETVKVELSIVGTINLIRVNVLGEKASCDLIRLTTDEAKATVKALNKLIKESEK